MRSEKGEGATSGNGIALAASLLLVLGGGWAPAPARAQGLTVDAGYASRNGPDLVTYRAGYTSPLTGPVWWQLHGVVVRDAGSDPVRRYGGGVELSAWRGGSGPYLAAGLDAGVESGGPDDIWGSWTAGGGYDLALLPEFTLSGDVRWRGFLSGEPGGVQVGVGLGYRWGGRSKNVRQAKAPDAAAASSEPPRDAGGGGRLRSDVVATARLVMGEPYRYGGDGEGGFDCSGLIQYAYGAHGVTVPRVSTDQAQVGDAVDRVLERLEPGDILTFSSSAGGSKVSHVGLYVGDGRFIHSASSRGVSESRLSTDDPNGAWWYARWIGARRIITDS